MKKNSLIAPEASGAFSALFQKYIKGNSALDQLYQYELSPNGVLKFANEQDYQQLDRSLLVEALLKQNHSALYFTEAQKKNIESLIHKQTYTITTGHQLCLFSGPLYFIYKIITVINLAEKLNRTQSEKKFVPVFWMATEDHDFDEINHLHLSDKTLRWKRDGGGAVGDLDMSGMRSVIDELKTMIGLSDLSQSWISAIEDCYLGAKNLAEATRNFVNFLFSSYGVIIIDANHRVFKSQFKSIFEQDIFEHKNHETYQSTLKYFEQNHLEAQVLVRPINCFYMKDGLRARIEKQGDIYKIVDTDLQFTTQELEQILDHQIDAISPNVILRPVYQQSILPNAAYIGGPAEVDYWLQLKAIFDLHKVAFPVLVPRQFALLLDEKSLKILAALQLKAGQLLVEDAEIPKLYLKTSGKAFAYQIENEGIQLQYQSIIDRLKQLDPTLENAGKAQRKKMENGLEKLQKKANKAIQLQESVAIKRLLKIKSKLLPNGALQERHDNIMMYDISSISEGIAEFKANLDADAGVITVLEF